MQQISALDNLMLDGGLPNLPMHMSAIMIYDSGGHRGSVALRETFRERFGEIVDALAQRSNISR